MCGAIPSGYIKLYMCLFSKLYFHFNYISTSVDGSILKYIRKSFLKHRQTHRYFKFFKFKINLISIEFLKRHWWINDVFSFSLVYLFITCRSGQSLTGDHAPLAEHRTAHAQCSSRSWRRCVFVHEVRGRSIFLRSVIEPSEPNAAMAGVFDIDLDQPEETVSDDENEEVLWQHCQSYINTVFVVWAQGLAC